MSDAPIKIFSYACLAHAVITLPLAYTPVLNILGASALIVYTKSISLKIKNGEEKGGYFRASLLSLLVAGKLTHRNSYLVATGERMIRSPGLQGLSYLGLGCGIFYTLGFFNQLRLGRKMKKGWQKDEYNRMRELLWQRYKELKGEYARVFGPGVDPTLSPDYARQLAVQRTPGRQ